MNILLVRTGGLGDSIVTLPVAQKIKKQNRDVSLHVLGNHTMLAVARLSGIFDGLHSLDTGEFYHIYSDSPTSVFLQSFFSQFETVYFFTSAQKERITASVIASGAKNCRVLDPRHPGNSQLHITEYLMKILGDANESFSSLSFPEIDITRNGKKKRNGLLISPGSGGYHKNWPLDNYISIAKNVSMDFTFLLGPSEIERGMDEEILMQGFPVEKVHSLDDLCVILSGAEKYLGNDSGVSHLASLCDTPSVVLFGPTDPDLWRPLGRKVTIVSSHDGTMNGIAVSLVLRVLGSNVTR